MSIFYWTLIAVALGLVGGALHWWDRRRRAKDHADWLAIDARLTAEGKVNEALWVEWDAEIDRRVEAIKLMTKNPPHVVSLLVGEDYPRFSVFEHKVKVGYRQTRYKSDRREDGERYPTLPPPTEFPKITETYVRLTRNTFDSQDEAEQWLVLYLNPAKRQTEHNIYGTKLGAYGAMDAEREAGGI